MLRTLCREILFLSVLETFPPTFPQTMLIFLFLKVHNIELGCQGGGGGTREITLDANEIGKEVKYQKVSFS